MSVLVCLFGSWVVATRDLNRKYNVFPKAQWLNMAERLEESQCREETAEPSTASYKMYSVSRYI